MSRASKHSTSRAPGFRVRIREASCAAPRCQALGARDKKPNAHAVRPPCVVAQSGGNPRRSLRSARFSSRRARRSSRCTCFCSGVNCPGRLFGWSSSSSGLSGTESGRRTPGAGGGTTPFAGRVPREALLPGPGGGGGWLLSGATKGGKKSRGGPFRRGPPCKMRPRPFTPAPITLTEQSGRECQRIAE